MDSAVWSLALLGLAFTVAVLWIIAMEAADRRHVQSLRVEAHKAAIARVRDPVPAPLLGVVQPPPEVETFTGTAHCLRCKEKREFTGTVGLNARGSRMARGTCPVCGAGLSRLLPKAG